MVGRPLRHMVVVVFVCVGYSAAHFSLRPQ